MICKSIPFVTIVPISKFLRFGVVEVPSTVLCFGLLTFFRDVIPNILAFTGVCCAMSMVLNFMLQRWFTSEYTGPINQSVYRHCIWSQNNQFNENGRSCYRLGAAPLSFPSPAYRDLSCFGVCKVESQSTSDRLII